MRYGGQGRLLPDSLAEKDGDPRLIAGGTDIGADEAPIFLLLPLVLKP